MIIPFTKVDARIREVNIGKVFWAVFDSNLSVVVWAWVGKEFPDMRQNEREIKFIRVEDAVRTVGHLKGKPMLNRGPSVRFSSVAQSCPTLCDPVNRSTPGLPIHHKLPECTQTHAHRVSDAIQPSHPLLSPSPPAPNPSTGVLSPLYTQGTRSGMGVLQVICWLDEARMLGGGSKANTFSLCGIGGETGYAAQEDLKFVNSYNMGEGRTIRVWVFCSAFQDPPWFYMLFHPWVTTVSKY